MWQVWIFDATDDAIARHNIVPHTAGMEYFTLWGGYLMQDEAIFVRNDLIHGGAYAKIIWQSA